MNINLSFVEFDAANGLQGMSLGAFTLLSTAKISRSGNRREWIVTGNPDAFAMLRNELLVAEKRFLRLSIATAVSNIIQCIDGAFAAALPPAGDTTDKPESSVLASTPDSVLPC